MVKRQNCVHSDGTQLQGVEAIMVGQNCVRKGLLRSGDRGGLTNGEEGKREELPPQVDTGPNPQRTRARMSKDMSMHD